MERAKRILLFQLGTPGDSARGLRRGLATTLREDYSANCGRLAKLLLKFPTWLMQYRQTILERAFFRPLRNF